MTEIQYPIDEWKRRMPLAYHSGIHSDGSAYFTCPMGSEFEYSVEAYSTKYPGVRFGVSGGTNECPCSYWFDVSIPARLIREETPFESASRKIRAINFTADELAALKRGE